MNCPSCNKPMDISEDGTRAYCPRVYCHAMVKLDDRLYGLGDVDDNNNSGLGPVGD